MTIDKESFQARMVRSLEIAGASPSHNNNTVLSVEELAYIVRLVGFDLQPSLHRPLTVRTPSLEQEAEVDDALEDLRKVLPRHRPPPIAYHLEPPVPNHLVGPHNDLYLSPEDREEKI